MAADAVKKIDIENKTSSKNSSNSSELIRSRRSQELVIGFCGAVGSGVKNLKEKLEYELKQHGYHVEHIRLSELISSTLDSSQLQQVEESSFKRYKILQDAGDKLRQIHGNQTVAELAIRKITLLRESLADEQANEVPAKNTSKIAYIVNQIKHPAEIELLSEVYRNNFYLIGLLRTEKEREQNLREERIKDSEINILIERDRKSNLKHGQQVEASLHKADYFIRNIEVGKEISASVIRFIKLIHGIDNITPTDDEIGICMFRPIPITHFGSIRSVISV